MNTMAVEIRVPEALKVALTDDTLSVDLSDGRSISVPIAWFPRLLHSNEQERNNWRLIGRGLGIHWQDIDEDIHRGPQSLKVSFAKNKFSAFV